MNDLTDEDRQARDEYRRLKQLKEDSQAVMQWTPNQGEPMDQYIARVTSAATCGNEDAKACLEGVMTTAAYKWWCESLLKCGATIH